MPFSSMLNDKVTILKNNNWNEVINNVQPTFVKQNQLLYTYSNKTNFWGGNEYLNFDSKIIRNKSLNIVKITKNPNYKKKIANKKLNEKNFRKTLAHLLADVQACFLTLP